jgi:hypothetical protein
MDFGTLLWKSVILISVALVLRNIVGIGSVPRQVIITSLLTMKASGQIVYLSAVKKHNA